MYQTDTLGKNDTGISLVTSACQMMIYGLHHNSCQFHVMPFLGTLFL